MTHQVDHAPARKLTLAEILEIFAAGQLPLKFTAYDGSTAGPDDAAARAGSADPARHHLPRHRARRPRAGPRLRLRRPRDRTVCTPAIPTSCSGRSPTRLDFKRPPARVLANIVRSIGFEHLKPIAPPPQEALPRWRRIAEGLRHSKTRDAEAIHHHYDVSNTFYEWVLGPSMTYTCACYPHPDATLEEAQENKYRLVFEKLRLKPGDRLLDVGCGWGGMVRYAARHGVKAIGVTLSKEQAAWAQKAIAERGPGRPRRGPPRRLPRRRASRGFDAVSSIGLTEHIGVHNYPSYFRFLQVEDAHRRAAAQPLHHPARQQDGARLRRVSSTATSSPTASSPARAASSPRRRTSVSRWCTKRTCATTTR